MVCAGCNLRGLCAAGMANNNYVLKFPPGSSAQQKARAAEKALKALPEALQRAQTAEAALKEMTDRTSSSPSGKAPPPQSPPRRISSSTTSR